MVNMHQGGKKIILGGGGGTIMGLIVLPLQFILVNTCMHNQAKKWGRHQHPVPPLLPTPPVHHIYMYMHVYIHVE